MPNLLSILLFSAISTIAAGQPFEWGWFLKNKADPPKDTVESADSVLPRHPSPQTGGSKNEIPFLKVDGETAEKQPQGGGGPGLTKEYRNADDLESLFGDEARKTSKPEIEERTQKSSSQKSASEDGGEFPFRFPSSISKEQTEKAEPPKTFRSVATQTDEEEKGSNERGKDEDIDDTDAINFQGYLPHLPPRSARLPKIEVTIPASKPSTLPDIDDQEDTGTDKAIDRSKTTGEKRDNEADAGKKDTKEEGDDEVHHEKGKRAEGQKKDDDRRDEGNHDGTGNDQAQPAKACLNLPQPGIINDFGTHILHIWSIFKMVGTEITIALQR